MRAPVAAWVAALAAVAAVVVAAALGLGARRDPERCPEGLVATGSRCCGAGQAVSGGACTGEPRACSSAQERTQAGCVPRPGRVWIAGGRIPRVAPDWEGDGAAPPPIDVPGFWLDRSEVTAARFFACAPGARCPAPEPGLPVTSVTAEEAAEFCARAGGRLPEAAEWLAAAAGVPGRRYPWGMTGLVCRRAAFGLAQGPCADDGGPELAGARPDGASPEGVLDLAGNVAEWSREPDGTHLARGGSFRSRAAGELKSWAARASGAAPDVGFRCAYSR